jgi:hypothetical protein
MGKGEAKRRTVPVLWTPSRFLDVTFGMGKGEAKRRAVPVLWTPSRFLTSLLKLD